MSKKPTSEKLIMKKPSLPLPLLLVIGGGVLLVITAVLMLRGKNTPAVTAPALPGIKVAGPYPDVLRIAVEDAKAALDAGSAVFVDVRGGKVFAEAHIPGALSITQGELEARLGELNPDEWIIFYCT